MEAVRLREILLVLVLGAAGCGGDSEPSTGGDGDADADADADGDADGDGDTDADADADGDADADADADADGDADGLAGCDPPATGPGDFDCTMQRDGVDRVFHLHVPASYADRPDAGAPLVLNFHGLSSNGNEQAEWSQMIPKSDAAGFIVVHPEGTGAIRGWNSGNEQTASDVDDVAFAVAIVDSIAGGFDVDAHRVYTTGFSNGGFMSQRLACEQAGVFAAAASVAGLLSIDSCVPGRPFPILHFHGTSDPIVSYDGGGFAGNDSVDDTMSGWATRNGCGQSRTVTFENGDATCEQYDGCPVGAEVEVCTIDGGGHTWPGGADQPNLFGRLSTDISATDHLWDFFAAHSRP